MAKKVREVGNSSNQPPPPNAPRWSISKDWQEGIPYV